MSRRTPLLLLGIAVFLLANSVGAAAPVGATQADLSTNEGVAAYLSSKGLKAKAFVIQRGRFNYAGPKCPGRRWNCTKKTQVVQVASGTHGRNRLECEPGGTLTTTTTGGTRTITCIVYQNASRGKNHARCSLDARDVSPVVVTCQVNQTNVNGDNVARVHERVVQRDGADQRATLNAQVTQTNGAGDNDSNVKQTIDQTSHDVAMASAPTQNQEGRFSSRIAQSSETGSNVSHLLQDLDQTGKASGNSSIVQRQFGDHFGDVDQTVGDVEPTAAVSKRKSKQRQSKSFSKSRAHQSERQRLKGPGRQIQIGPLACCSTQLGGDSERANVRIRQDSKQTASQKAAEQSLSITGRCTTVGNCGIRHRGQNDEDSITVRKTCSGSAGEPCTLFIQTTCESTSEGSFRYSHEPQGCVSSNETPSVKKRRP